MSPHEVVIVGGGPAGVSTALFLAHRRPDLADRIVVLERDRYPRDKYCAGALGGRADKALAAIGVRVDVPSVAIHGVSAAFGRDDVSLREGDIGRVVRRIEFDHALSLAARGRGIRIVEGARATAVSLGGAGARVESSAGVFDARVVVGADGVGSVVRRALGVPFGRLRAQAVEVDTEPVAADRARDLLHFDMSDRSYPGYSWDFPTLVDGRELVCRGTYVLHDGARDPGAPAADAQRILGARLSALGLDPGSFRFKRFSERGLDGRDAIARPKALLVGEAAGIDPILGEGIAQAIDYGALAGAYLAERLDGGDLRFADWGRRVALSKLGQDLTLRTATARSFYGPARELIERRVQETPEFLRFGMRYFGGKPPLAANVLRAAAAISLLAGRIGATRALAALPARLTRPGAPEPDGLRDEPTL